MSYRMKVPVEASDSILQAEEVPLKEQPKNCTTPCKDGRKHVKLPPFMKPSGETLEEFDPDVAAQEGDILVPEDRNAVKTLWKKKGHHVPVPYLISDDLRHRTNEILEAFKMISERTCIKFHRRTSESDYLWIIPGRGCASYVGFQGHAQSVYFAQSCSVGNLCHELLHALGLHHEHTRTDRDDYITVHWDSVINGKENNFLVKNGDTLNLPYDLDSIMHYGKYYFSSDYQPTIVPKRKPAHIGQRTHLSELDVERLRRLYRCGTLNKSLYMDSGHQKLQHMKHVGKDRNGKHQRARGHDTTHIRNVTKTD
ncbi:low choriolytic enzyme [Chanos chanos]|uniref:Metalloendopeptidase n=1 Tax=Chanos chanos TaxID=29144 RepID=A0A6J2UY58_CHACN|nr:low choriolytic enzyme-like [Chanos chanos]